MYLIIYIVFGFVLAFQAYTMLHVCVYTNGVPCCPMNGVSVINHLIANLSPTPLVIANSVFFIIYCYLSLIIAVLYYFKLKLNVANFFLINYVLCIYFNFISLLTHLRNK